MCIPSQRHLTTQRVGMDEIKVEPETDLSFSERIAKSRHDVAASIKDFTFNKKRVRILTEAQDVSRSGKAILYWMLRDQRVYDNWSLLYAQKIALKMKLPLIVVFCFHPLCDGPNATLRSFSFMIKGLQEVEAECKAKNISFDVLRGSPDDVLSAYVVNQNIGAVVTDFNPLREPDNWTRMLIGKLPPDVPLAQVDAHNIVPAWILSDKQAYQAQQLRPKFINHLPDFLTHFPDVAFHPHKFVAKCERVDWKFLMHDVAIDRSVEEVPGIAAGSKAAILALEHFIVNHLKDFETYKNNPTKDVSPNLSHYFHFGHLSAQRAYVEVQKWEAKKDYKDSVNGFYEEAVIRREMSDNYCLYNNKYDCLSGAYDWAIISLNEHRKDKRAFIYPEKELENASTHDELFNAATIQLKSEGRMHRYMKMYWPKKIQEWTASPEEAIEISNRLLNKYAYDARDPESYLAVMWSICGLHDRPWPSRPIIGKIRTMMFEGCKKKFDVPAFIQRYKLMQ